MLDFAELAMERGGLDATDTSRPRMSPAPMQERFAELDLDFGQEFHNSYEQSKFESEQLVRTHSELPYTILRPSIVVGDRRSGWTAAFNVLYWPLRAFARGPVPAVPAIPTAPVDVVSIDYVADAIHELCECPRDRSRPITSRPERAPARSARSLSSPAAISAPLPRCSRRPSSRRSKHGPSARRSRPRACTSPISRSGRCSTMRHPGAPGPCRHRAYAAARVSRAAARLRDAQSLGQAPIARAEALTLGVAGCG